MAYPKPLPAPLCWALADAGLLSLVWLSLHQLRFGELPPLSRGPLVVIPLFVALQWLLGSYTGLARQTLSLQHQLNRFLTAAALVILALVIGYRLTGLSLDATIGRGFLLPLLLSGALSGGLLRLLVASRHLWQPQQRWLILANPIERQLLAEELERGGCEVPAAVEWRPLTGAAPLPALLPSLLQLQGVAIGHAAELPSGDATQLLLWQRQGLVLEPLLTWAETHLHRSPPGLVAHQAWVEQVNSLQGLRSPQNLRLKRLLDLSLAVPLVGLLAAPLALLALAMRLAGCPLQLRQRPCLGMDGEMFPQWRLSGAPRLERLGLAALPQLINVVRGEMSLVGPRPVTPGQQAELEALEPAFALRLRCKPGMTGWGRISGPAPRSADAQRWELGRDLYYLRHGSAGLDVGVLTRAVVWLLWKLISGGRRG
jgi:lipopolysaccharide/colanic/teichoic acid biosynthesis glycosyltransferase